MDLAIEQQYPTPYAGLSIFAALMMSVARRNNCPNLKTSAQDEYDYVIVGAGSAGCALARRLAEKPCVTVLLLEAGGAPPYVTSIPATERTLIQTNVDYSYMTVPQKNVGDGVKDREIVWAAGKMVGGSSVLNDIQYSRGNKKNYDSWAANGAKGWSYKDVLPYFKMLENNTDPDVANNGFHGTEGPIYMGRPNYTAEYKAPLLEAVSDLGYKLVDPSGPTQTGFVNLQGTLIDGQLSSAPMGYLVPIENQTNIDILPNATVTKVLTKYTRLWYYLWLRGKTTATGVEFVHDGETKFAYARKEVIVSAGTTHTPQVLMLSGIGPKDQLKKLKIPVVANLPGVGQNLQDHIGTNINFRLSDDIPVVTTKLTNETIIQEYIDNRSGILASAQLVTLLAFLENNKTVSETDYPDHALYFLEAPDAIASQDFNLKDDVFEVLYGGKYKNKPFYTCFTHLLHPRSRGTITLKSSSYMDPPIIDPMYLSDQQDITDIVEGLKTCKKVGSHPAMSQVGSEMFDVLVPGCEDKAGNDDEYFACQVKSIGASFYHPVGTAKMGNDDMAVVDNELKVRGIENLRVVDASIMPTIVTGNTNIPTMMIAEKAADMIKKKIKC